MGPIALYCSDPKVLPRVRASLGPSRAVRVCETWHIFERTAPGAACLVVVIEWLRGGELVQRLIQLRSGVPHQPLVLVTAKDADAVRQLSRIRVEEFVWPHEVERGLPVAVDRAAATTPLERIRRSVEGLEQLPPRLKRGLVAALTGPRPMLRVDEVAVAAGCDRRTLWRELQQLTGGALRLQDLLDWIVLLRLGMMKVPGRKWSAIAGELGVHEHSIGRMIHRLTGMTQRRFTTAGPATVVEQFEARVLALLVEASAQARRPLGRGGRARQRAAEASGDDE
jgi:hypothetical protein